MMCAKLSKNSDPKRILVVSLTNIGDAVLTCPVIDILRSDFPTAKMDVAVGPKAIPLFADNPNFRVKVFDKRALLKDKISWFLDLWRQHYDCVVDLRRTMLTEFLRPAYATPALSPNSFKGHKKESHLNRLREVYDFDSSLRKPCAVVTTGEDEQFFEKEVSAPLEGKNFTVIAPGAADSAKRWHPKGFAAVADYLSSQGERIVFVGDAQDAVIVEDIQKRMQAPALSLAGKITLRQLAYVLKKCSWALTHDSGVMHLSSYLNAPLVVLWGPTSLEKYAPWGGKSVVVKRNENCARCRNPRSESAHTCMNAIEVQDVINAIRKLRS
jgi:ADP-heptose:LPS heptosyltransferase